ncbi:Protein translocase subunit SecE [Pseudovibrio axinellae]|uniref:Protein translocase subunit SecE n=1 Tax=Pseudovibrio axinellae TaxID=989403 RepID=A0A166A1Z3_9HYPH|nr:MULTISPECIES: preprotein translocase subunit SecE [Pseudovibrio]KZL20537.1 Protein translocase subunit SecE [Pseudovibrio axinellae]SEQ91503.1 protein translocase subunit secE/sec61 gamma [Pseudovibrio axinellae]
MAKTNPFTFIQQVRSETAKVTWPTRKETGVTTLMVFIMVFLAAMFFLAADQLMSLGISFLLGF